MRFGLVLLLVVSGCRHDPPPPPTLEIADPTTVPSGAERITCRLGPKQSMLALDDAGLHLRFITSQGNTVSMLGRDVIAGAADVTLPDAVARFADGHAGAEWLDVQAKVTSPDGQSATMKLSLHIDKAMEKRLDAARSAAMLFPGETAAPSTSKISWVHPAGGAPYVLGEGRWRDIDLVALETVKSAGGKFCGSAPNGWNQTTILASHDVSHVELFDRRAGKRTDETTIEGTDVCPSERDGASTSNDAAVRAWIASKLAR